MATPATRTRWTSRPLWVNTINALQRSPEWSSTAVVIAYDDSDGWYDHQIGPIVNRLPPLPMRSAAPACAAPAPARCRA